MKRIVLFALIASMALSLCACSCKHEWTPATCTTSETCTKCGEKNGSPLGHNLGEWEIAKEASVGHSGQKVRKCLRCGNIVSKQEYQLDSYIKDGYFMFDVKDFSNLMDSNIKTLDENYSASIETSDELFTSTGRRLSYCVLSESGVSFQIIIFLNNDDYSDGFDAKDLHSANAMIPSDNTRHVALTLVDMIMSCDPSLSLDEVKELANALLTNFTNYGKGNFTRNGLIYTLTVNPLNNTQYLFRIEIE